MFLDHGNNNNVNDNNSNEYHEEYLNAINDNYNILKKRKNSVASVRKRTIPTEQPPLVSEISANFLRIEGATWSA
jgi:uncharacterized protein YxjI